MEVGIDLVDNERINVEILKKKIMSQLELEAMKKITSDKRLKEFVASRFAVKEALFKAYPYVNDFRRISVLNEENGKPYILIDEEKRKEFKISLSHENKYSIAIVYYEEEFK